VIRALLAGLVLAGCAQALLKPMPTVMVNGDPFTDQAFVCNGVDAAPLITTADACGDAIDTSSCLLARVTAGASANDLACAVGEALAAASAQVRFGVADEQTKLRIKALQFWISATGVVLHNRN
jgi:hypothetical protein